MRDAIVRYGGVVSDGDGEVGRLWDGEVSRLCVGDVIDDRGSNRFDCAPAAIPSTRV